tara:strand:+ start:77115 stop:77510 length:396 start_codon:yes stop_codon:yes gene_type:complete
MSKKDQKRFCKDCRFLGLGDGYYTHSVKMCCRKIANDIEIAKEYNPVTGKIETDSNAPKATVERGSGIKKLSLIEHLLGFKIRRIDRCGPEGKYFEKRMSDDKTFSARFDGDDNFDFDLENNSWFEREAGL